MFKDNLIALRKRNKMTQVELAKAIGISRSALSMYEAGQREPNFETLEIIAKYFDVPMSSLIERKGHDIVMEYNAAEERRKEERLQKIREQIGSSLPDINVPVDAMTAQLWEAVKDMTSEEKQTLLDIIKAIKRK